MYVYSDSHYWFTCHGILLLELNGDLPPERREHDPFLFIILIRSEWVCTFRTFLFKMTVWYGSLASVTTRAFDVAAAAAAAAVVVQFLSFFAWIRSFPESDLQCFALLHACNSFFSLILSFHYILHPIPFMKAKTIVCVCPNDSIAVWMDELVALRCVVCRQRDKKRHYGQIGQRLFMCANHC